MPLTKPEMVLVLLLSAAIIIGGGGVGVLALQASPAEQLPIGAAAPQRAPQVKEKKAATNTISIKNFVVDVVDIERMTINISKRRMARNAVGFVIQIGGQGGQIVPQGPNADDRRPTKIEFLRVARDARIFIKGKPGKLSDLRVGMNIAVQLGIGKEQVVVQGKDIDLEREGMLVREIRAE